MSQDTSKHLQTVLDRMVNRVGDPASIASSIPNDVIVTALQNLEHGVMEMFHNIQAVGTQVDYSRLVIQMIQRVLVEKNIISEEDLKAKFDKEVQQPMIEFRQAMQEKLRQAVMEQKGNIQQTVQGEAEGDLEDSMEEPSDSDVMLSSERFGGIKVFGRKNDQEEQQS